ncbi:MAG: AMP-binding protein [Rhodospirillales bacterium]
MSETDAGIALSVPDYEGFVAGFTAAQVEAELAGSLEGGLNACIECCDRHARPGRVALNWESKDGRSGQVTFAELSERSARFANLLHARGVRPGEIVAGLLPRIPELLAIILGTWRLGAVYQPLFTAFGPKAIEHRVAGRPGQADLHRPRQPPQAQRRGRLSAGHHRRRRRRRGLRRRPRAPTVGVHAGDAQGG